MAARSHYVSLVPLNWGTMGEGTGGGAGICGVGLPAMAWRLMSWDLPDHLLVVGRAVCAVSPPIPWLGVI